MFIIKYINLGYWFEVLYFIDKVFMKIYNLIIKYKGVGIMCIGNVQLKNGGDEMKGCTDPKKLDKLI